MNIELPNDIIWTLKTNEKNYRKACKISQKKLADETGVAIANIRRFEQTGLISLGNFVKIVVYFSQQNILKSLFENAPYKSFKELMNAHKLYK